MNDKDKKYERDYKDMQLAKKRVNNLHYVFGAMMHDAGKMKVAGKMKTAEFEILKSRSSQIVKVDMKSALDEYLRLVDVVYAPEICPVLEGVE